MSLQQPTILLDSDGNATVNGMIIRIESDSSASSIVFDLGEFCLVHEDGTPENVLRVVIGDGVTAGGGLTGGGKRSEIDYTEVTHPAATKLDLITFDSIAGQTYRVAGFYDVPNNSAEKPPESYGWDFQSGSIVVYRKKRPNNNDSGIPNFVNVSSVSHSLNLDLVEPTTAGGSEPTKLTIDFDVYYTATASGSNSIWIEAGGAITMTVFSRAFTVEVIN